MPSLSVTTTTTTTVELRPSLKRKLLTELRAYAELKAQADAIELAMNAHKATIRGLREGTGEKSLELEGFKTTDVTGETSKLDTKLLLLNGVTMGQINAATITKPKKAYELVTCPK